MEQTGNKPPAFTLRDLGATEPSFPAGRHALLCFVKEDCPTCRLTIPLVEAAYRADWQSLLAEVARIGGVAAPEIGWSSYPEQCPGCGSKSVQPGVAERIETPAASSRMTVCR